MSSNFKPVKLFCCVLCPVSNNYGSTLSLCLSAIFVCCDRIYEHDIPCAGRFFIFQE